MGYLFVKKDEFFEKKRNNKILNASGVLVTASISTMKRRLTDAGLHGRIARRKQLLQRWQEEEFGQ